MASSPLDSFPFPVLIADIGGTNARFGLVEAEGSGFRELGRTPTRDHVGSLEAIRDFALARAEVRPRSAILALAAAIEGDEIPLTNCPWVIEPKRLIAKLGFEEVVAINDFEAQALALPSLGDADLVTIGGGATREGATKAVIGPGTGLGVAVLVHSRGCWIPMPGEGGHVTLAPLTAREETIWHELTRRHGRVGGEVIVSGPGMVRLHEAILAVDGLPSGGLDAAAITAAANAGEARAVETLTIFVSALGRLTGDLALTVLPHGGIYIGGGIPPRILPWLTDGRFRAAFEDKAPFHDLIAGMSTQVVVHSLPAFLGLTAFARAPETYAVDIERRRWTA